MAINTSGFRLSVLPQYTPVNPSLVAFNPQNFAGGVNQTLGIASLLDKIQADREMRDEIAATRALRVDAMNAANRAATARNTAILPNIGAQAALEGGKIARETRLLDPQEKAEMAKLGSIATMTPFRDDAEKRITEADLKLLGKATDTKGMELDARRAKAESDVLMQETREQVELARANDMLEKFASIAPLENRNALMQLTMSIANIADDRERSIEFEKAKVALTKAQTEKALAEADYALGLGRQGRAITEEEKISKIGNALRTLESTLVAGGTQTLKAYMSNTRDKSGKVKTEGSIPFTFGLAPGLEALTPDIIVPDKYEKPIKDIDPSAEVLVKRYNELQQMLSSGGQPAQPAPVVAQPAESSGPTPPQAAINYLKANPNMASDFDKKYGAGAAAQYLK